MSHSAFVPKWVAPPSGGWFHQPKNHHVNGVIAFAGFFAVLYGIYVHGEKNVHNPKLNYSVDTVNRWNAAAAKKD